MWDNISLQANALSLGAVMIGAFDDQEVKEVPGIKEEALYIIPVGKM
jgi:nitroreductase